MLHISDIKCLPISPFECEVRYIYLTSHIETQNGTTYHRGAGIYTCPPMVQNTTKAHASALLTQKLNSLSQRLYSPADLTQLFTEIRKEWGLPRSLTLTKFLDLALETKTLQKVDLSSTYPLHTTRYHRGIFTPYELALSLRPNSFLSHGTAAFLHGLIAHTPEFVYANQEQSAKDQSGMLTQAALDRAFSGKQRQSRFIVTHNKTRIRLISGKNTQELGVQKLTGPDGESLRLTDVERTLIDIAVRPVYAGGTQTVLQIYRRAIHKISVHNLTEMLKQLDYLYPYHQAIGFLLTRAGNDPKSLATLRKLGLKYHFFLAHGMKKTKFDAEWRIHYPEDLQ
jgi:predicted transcriptional regulator of viral defense system